MMPLSPVIFMLLVIDIIDCFSDYYAIIDFRYAAAGY